MANMTQSQKSSDVLGLPEDRVDGRLKVTGGARYSAEMPVTGALHGVMVMSTIAKGQIASMDTSAAQSQPQVVTVLTPFNAPKLPNNPGSQENKPPSPQGRVLSVLQDTNVYYQNQPIGLVLAETLEAAQFAASLVKVTYNAQTPTLDIDSERANIYKPSKANQEPTDSL